LEFFENNFTSVWLKACVRADPNMGDLVQREHPKIRVEKRWTWQSILCTAAIVDSRYVIGLATWSL